MITVTIYKDSGQYSRFTVEGHAGYAQEGFDIICSAVSVLTLNTVNSIEAFTGDSFQAEQDEESGFLSFSLSSPISPESKLLLNSLVLGLQNIEEEYGRPYIHIRFKEV